MEQFEQVPHTHRTSTISGKELHARISPEGDSNSRFLPKEEGGVFHYSPLGRFSEIHKEGMHYSIVEDNEKIVAIAEVQENPYDESELWFKSVTVDENLKGTGLSELLLREVFKFVKSTGKKIKLSSYTKEGAERLPRRIETLAREFGVEVVAADD